MALRGPKEAGEERAAFGAVVTLAVMAGIWILLVGGTKPHEMIMGAASMALAAAFLYKTKQSDTLDLRFRAADVAAGWRPPGYLASDVWVLIKVLVLDLLRIKRAETHDRVWGFRTSKNEPVLAARRALATVYTSATPNSIVVGIDYEQNRILIHQMQPSRLTAMQRELGAAAFGQHGLGTHRAAARGKHGGER
ncbi:Na+/H+ antiporter subunit E [Edaphobacter paludis]|uniref:Na+/H+ antiporter subunit E n=1 Tax=Edaphobacter paludis TaxID=3035702 RepID=A0AAU7D4Z2_9BACT